MSILVREGVIGFNDASLHITESPKCQIRGDWEKLFKQQVFKRVIQQLNRLGWKCVVPQEMIKQYSLSFAQSHRFCSKGNLKADLSISGRCIDFKMFQNVNAPKRPDHDGRYEFNKEELMPYLMRLEMERTRRRIATYLWNVMGKYSMKQPERKIGFNGITALESINNRYKESCHFKAELGRPDGDERSYNNQSADKGVVTHGAKVYTTDYHGRVVVGTAYYNINNMWWVVAGQYTLFNKASFEIYLENPGNLRQKRNQKARSKRLHELLSTAINSMDFERAATLRDLLFPKNVPLYVVRHTEHNMYHRANFSGYTDNINEAGKFVADDVNGWNVKPNQVIEIKAAA